MRCRDIFRARRYVSFEEVSTPVAYEGEERGMAVTNALADSSGKNFPLAQLR
jgi:hypothetical protein